MVSKNNTKLLTKRLVGREVPHYSLRKLGIGLVSILLGTTMYLGANETVANADVTPTESGSESNNSVKATTTTNTVQEKQVTLSANNQNINNTNNAKQQSTDSTNTLTTQGGMAKSSVATEPANSSLQSSAVLTNNAQVNQQAEVKQVNETTVQIPVDVTPAVTVNGTTYNLTDGNDTLQLAFRFNKNGEVDMINGASDNIKNVEFNPQSKQLLVKYGFDLSSLSDNPTANTSDYSGELSLTNFTFKPAEMTYRFDLSGLTPANASQYLTDHVSSDVKLTNDAGVITGVYQVPYQIAGRFIPVDEGGHLLAQGVFDYYYPVKDNQISKVLSVPTIPGYHPKNGTQVTVDNPYKNTKIEYVKDNVNALILFYIDSTGASAPVNIEIPYTKESNGKFAQLDLKPLDLTNLIKNKYPKLWNQLQNDSVNFAIAVDGYGREVGSYDPNTETEPLYLVTSAIIGENSVSVRAGGKTQTKPYNGIYRYKDSGNKDFYINDYGTTDVPFYGPKAIGYSNNITMNLVNTSDTVFLPIQLGQGTDSPNELLAYAQNPDGTRSNRVIGKWTGLLSQENNYNGFPYIQFTSTDTTFSGKVYPIYLQMSGDGGSDIGFVKLDANVLPVIQQATLKIIDETDNDQLLATNNATGVYTHAITFANGKSDVQKYLAEGYVFDHAQNDAEKTMVNSNGEVITNYDNLQFGNYDDNDATNQTFTIYLRHGVASQEQTRTASRTIRYVLDDGKGELDADKPIMQKDGQNIKDNVQTITYTRTVYIDKVTGKVVNAKYVDDNGQPISSNAGKGHWVVDTTNTTEPKWNASGTNFTEVKSPEVSGYSVNPVSVSAEKATMPSEGNTNQIVYVVYKPIPASYTADRENKTVTRTINYLDGQTDKAITNAPAIVQQATLYRYQIKNEKGNVVGYGTLSQDGHTYHLSDVWKMDQNGWQDQISPDLTKLGYKKTPHFIDGQDASVVNAGQPNLTNPTDMIVNVYYDHDIIPVTPDKPGYGVTSQDLNRTVTRTIKYQNTQGSPVNGSPDDTSTCIQTAKFTRTAIVDKVTGQIIGYDTDDNGQVDVNATNGDAAWRSTDNIFKAVESKSPASLGYTNVNIASVGAETVAYNTPDQTITVTYSKVIPATPAYKNGQPETKTVTRTINYVDSVTGQPIPKNLAKTVTQDVNFTRMPILDEKGNVVAYGTVTNNGKSYTLQNWTTTGNWARVDSPDLTKSGYTAPTLTAVEQMVPSVNSKDQIVTVYYGHQIIPVTPDKPGNGLKNVDLVKTVIETVHYVGAGDQTPANKVAQLHFTGKAYYDAVTKKWTDAEGKVLKDQAMNITWQANDGNQFSAVITPTISGYTSSVQDGYGDGHGNVKEISGINQDSANINITVTYQRTSQPITPQPTVPQPTTPQLPTPQPTVPQPTTPRPTPSKPTISQLSIQSIPKDGSNHVTVQSQSVSGQNNSALPQTGNEDRISAATLGLMGLAIATGLGIGVTKKHFA